MRPEWNCTIDWTRPCRACSAPSPHECPYTYLLDDDDLAAIAQASRRAQAGSARQPARDQA